MRTLEQGIAFDRGYRETWKQYFGELTAQGLRAKVDRLTSGLDYESRQLCERQAALVPFLLPHPILKGLFFSEGLKRSLLPEKTVETLTQMGYFEDQQRNLDRLQRELDLPEEPLPELISHSGLRYVKQAARQRIEGRTIIDCGAYIGDTARLFAQHYAPKDIYALEPTQGSFDRMVDLVAQWGLRDVVVPLKLAVSDRSGTEVIWGEGVGASAVKKGTENPPNVEVDAISIDELVERHGIGSVGLIKLDVEGSEYKAVIGAANTIRRDRPVLLLSIYHTAKDFFEIKPLIEEMDLGYTMMVRKITDDFLKELVLICLPGDS